MFRKLKGPCHVILLCASQFCAKIIAKYLNPYSYKGAMSRGFCTVQVNSVLKSLRSAFTGTQNAPAESDYKEDIM